VVYHPLQESDGEVTGNIAVLTEVTLQVRARMELERANRELEEFAYASKAWAEKIGNQQAADLLQETLEEEEAADTKLAEVSEAILEAAAAFDGEPEASPQR